MTSFKALRAPENSTNPATGSGVNYFVFYCYGAYLLPCAGMPVLRVFEAGVYGLHCASGRLAASLTVPWGMVLMAHEYMLPTKTTLSQAAARAWETE